MKIWCSHSSECDLSAFDKPMFTNMVWPLISVYHESNQHFLYDSIVTSPLTKIVDGKTQEPPP
jgi:hypothetical protein